MFSPLDCPSCKRSSSREYWSLVHDITKFCKFSAEANKGKKTILNFFNAEYIHTLLYFSFNHHKHNGSGQADFSALTYADGCHQQCLPLLEVRGIASKQQPFMGGFMLHHILIQSGKNLLFLCQTSFYMLVPQSEII